MPENHLTRLAIELANNNHAEMKDMTSKEAMAFVLKILAKQALDEKRLTAIYRMDPAELDRILPLEVVPQPKKVSRIALVVVTGIDPAIGDELDQLIKKLGDPAWKNRAGYTFS